MKRFIVIATVVSNLPGLLWAGAVKAGPEFQVNTYTLYWRSGGAVAMDGAGNFVVTWTNWDQDGSDGGIFGQRFDSTGAPQGSEFQVNTYTVDHQAGPSLAMDAAGNFVVFWGSNGQDGSSSGIFGRHFDSAGVPRSSEFQANAYTAEAQWHPSVAMDAVGRFVVVWQSWTQDGSSWGIFGRRFDSAGIPQGPDFQVNTFTAGWQYRPSVAMDAAGSFVVVWQDQWQDGWSGIFGRRFDSAGIPQGSEFQVNAYTAGAQSYPSVAMDTAGAFVVVWVSDYQDGSRTGIFGQRFDSAGAHQGSEFQVNTYTTDWQDRPSVAADGRGNFVVVWESLDLNGPEFGIFGQRFDSAGAPRGTEFQASTYTLIQQSLPSVVMDEAGNFVVLWGSEDQEGQRSGVFGQRFYARSPEITDPLAGGTLDCRGSRPIRPTLTWDDDGYDRFRVLIAWDPDFGTGRQVTSGDTLLRTTTWTPPAKKWRKACARAVEANQESPVFYIKVFGVDRSLPKSDAARKRYSPVVQVNVQP